MSQSTSTSADSSSSTHPRANLGEPVEVGKAYSDDRSGDSTYLVVYLDDAVVLLRDEDGGTRLERRRHFENAVGAGRFKEADPEDINIPSGRVDRVRARIDQYERDGGRKAQHYAEAMQEALDILQGNESPDDRDPVDFTDVDGIGQKTATKLQSAGYVTKGDVRRASDQALLDVGGMGKSNLKNLRRAVT